MRVTIITATTALLAGLVSAPAAAAECGHYDFPADPGRASAAEFDQLREGMTLDEVRTLFGSSGSVTWANESSTGASMAVEWLGAVRMIDYDGWIEEAEISVVFSMAKATTRTTYKRVKVKVKNVKRAKRLGLRTWRWKSVKRVIPVPATAYSVDYFTLYSAGILRQSIPVRCY